MAMLKDDVMVGFGELFSIHKVVLQISLRVFFIQKSLNCLALPVFQYSQLSVHQ